MIQRIQSLYLSAVIIVSLLLFTGNMLRFSDESGRILNLIINGNLTDQTGQVIQKAEGTWSVMAILILICLISISTILLFRKRKKQLLLAGVLIILSTGLIALLSWYAFSMKAAFSMTVIPGLNMGLPVLILLFSFLAYRGILKDDRLVKSYDRLR